MNHYDVLGITRNAGDEEIRSAFRTLARRYHPDAGVGSSAQRFRQVVDAYETLSDPTRRHRYDLTLQPARTIPAEPMTQRPEPMTSRPEPFSSGMRAGTFCRSASLSDWDDLFELLRSRVARPVEPLTMEFESFGSRRGFSRAAGIPQWDDLFDAVFEDFFGPPFFPW